MPTRCLNRRSVGILFQAVGSMIRIIVGTIVGLQSTLCHHPLTMESVFYSRLMIGNGYTVYSANRRLIHPINALSFWRIGISPTATIQWLEQTKGLALTDAISQRAIRFLENLLTALTPIETVLLQTTRIRSTRRPEYRTASLPIRTSKSRSTTQKEPWFGA